MAPFLASSVVGNAGMQRMKALFLVLDAPSCLCSECMGGKGGNPPEATVLTGYLYIILHALRSVRFLLDTEQPPGGFCHFQKFVLFCFVFCVCYCC